MNDQKRSLKVKKTTLSIERREKMTRSLYYQNTIFWLRVYHPDKNGL